MNDFTPASDYAGLLRQAHALASLVHSKQAQIAVLQSQVQQLTTQLSLTDSAALEAERQTNAVLTQSLLDAEDYIVKLLCKVRTLTGGSC